MTEDPIELVRRFVEDWHAKDPARLVAYFTDDAVYHNIPMDPLVGKDAITQFFDSWMPTVEDMGAEIHHILADGPVVVTERTDTIVFPTGPVRLRILGIFEIEDGKIARWREYFDPAEFQSSPEASTAAG